MDIERKIMKQSTLTPSSNSTAIFSPCRQYRYALIRSWNPKLGLVLFIGLNPSDANEYENDPTIRRCISFVRQWGFGGLIMVNLFAKVSSKPQVLYTTDDPIGHENNYYLQEMGKRAKLCIACWGNLGNYLSRDQEVVKLFPELYVLGVNSNGQPKHPLYIKKSQDYFLWNS